ncbi:M23 family metallopeptidase [Lysobacter sp. K5869]|uniref:M23 family metallopeptidase n=1 Tax=Lysobacter sp. K5869 TaxID=2820808 RepID=UPI001C062A9B|nr:M23 family metallopeptidase [Lysobacter sp. K5869]QWP75446.1 M23 family metallopeptidase [Lysobacter sp. K5869]
MMLRRSSASVLALAAAAFASACAAAPVDTLDLAVPQTPAPVAVEGRERLLYELHLTNFGAAPLHLDGVSVLDADSGAALAAWRGDALAARGRVIGAQNAALDGALRPGERAVLYLEIDLPAKAPRALRHKVEFSAPGAEPGQVEGAQLAPRAAAALQLGPPLRGGPWAAVYAPQWPRGHRRVFYALDGRARLPGRYAIDFVRVDADGRTARGDADLAKNALGYGEPVLAVADGVIAAARDGIGESERVSQRQRHDFDRAPGNYLALALGDGRYALYEHLRPGSLKVRQGERVRRGQPLAELGFTGDSTGPHLHFHVADAPVPLAGEGVAFGFEAFDVLGHYPGAQGLGERPWQARAAELAGERRDELPESNAVIEFVR